MTLKTSFANDPSFGTRAKISDDGYSFEEAMNKIFEEAVIFSEKRAEYPVLMGLENVAQTFLNALMQLVCDFSKERSEEFDNSQWSHLKTLRDWKNFVLDL